MNPQGDFVWYEYLGEDVAAAKAFYSAVVGWKICDAGMPGQTYLILHAGDRPVGGIGELTAEIRDRGVPPCWTGYVGVADVDATVARSTAAGGAVHRTASDIPGVGRFAVVADPHGAVFILFHPSDPPPASPPLAEGTPGTIGWHELHAGNGAEAFAFYSEMFGWRKDTDMPMGAGGEVYRIFRTDDRPNGGMMTKTPETPCPFWLFYFEVEALDAAVARVTGAGGRVLVGPMQVPGGAWIVQCLDPEGAIFALVAPKR